MRRFILFSLFVLAAFVGAHELCSENDGTIDSKCVLDEVTASDEQQAILAEICGALNVTHADRLVPTVQHRRIDAGASVRDHCGGRTQGFLKWVPWPFYERYMHTPLNFMEKYLDRRADGAQNQSDVLIEVLPERYELLNVQPAGERRSQIVRSLELGTLDLHNSDTGTRILNGRIPYAYERLLDVRLNGVATNNTIIVGLSVRNGNRTSSADIADWIYGHRLATVQSEAHEFSKVLSAGDNALAHLIGSWVVQEYNVTATLVAIYAANANSTRQIQATVIDTAVANVHVVYDDSKIHNEISISSTGNAAGEGASDDRVVLNLPVQRGRRPINHFNNPDTTAVYGEPLMTSHHHHYANDSTAGNSRTTTVYPGFRPYFYLACLVLFGVMFLVFYDVGKKLLQDHKLKRRQRANIDGVRNGHLSISTSKRGGCDVELLIIEK